MVPRAMDKRGKRRAFPTKEQENERVELATNVGSIPIARSISSSVRSRCPQRLSGNEGRGRTTAGCCKIPQAS